MNTLNTYDSLVNSFYLAFYGRPADPAGLKFWSQQLANSEGNASAIIQAFATSEEAQVRFGADTAADRITEIYEQLFHRAPDAEGLAFWTSAIEQGHASLADVSIAILGGARGSDKTLSELRQKAADAFTAQVEASGSAYDGYASIEAARVLVRAVTPDATQDDLDLLVKAAVSFADTATTTPQVVEAIATGSTLLKLFDTARGEGDPVALAQTLADTAKAAAGNPVTLASLLRGGGMIHVLEVMPKDATLKDVVDALGKGGLPAAVEVVYPTKPAPTPTPTPKPAPTPEASMKLAFDHVSEGQLDARHDNVTNVALADITFKYTGNDLAEGQKFIASIDGGQTWDQVMLSTDSTGNTVTALGVDLMPKPQKTYDPSLARIQISEPPPFHVTSIELRAVDANGKVIDALTQSIVYDDHADLPGVNFDRAAVPGSGADISPNAGLIPGSSDVTGNAGFQLEGIEPYAKVEYASVAMANLNNVDIANTDTTTPSTGPVWSTDKPVLVDGWNVFQVRQTDVAGNISDARIVEIKLDTEAPAGTPSIELVQDTGPLDDDGITNVATLAVDGLDAAGDTGWEYSTDGGTTWIFGGVNDGSGKAELDLSTMGAAPVTLQVRQLDAAGNVSPLSEKLTFTIDTKGPDNVLSFDRIVGQDAGISTTGENMVDVLFTMSGGLPYDGIVEWRFKGGDGKWTALDQSAITGHGSHSTLRINAVDLEQADRTIEIRMNDYAGNHGGTFSQLIDGPAAAVPFEATFSADGLQVKTSVGGELQINGIGGGVARMPDGGNVVPTGTTVVGTQATSLVGTVTLQPADGVPLGVPGNPRVGLGTDGNNVLDSVQYAWGFDGDDVLNGDGSLKPVQFYGGAGDDLLRGGNDADTLVGGTGADVIDLGDDTAVDTVLLAAGDTATGPRADGIAAGVDIVLHAGIGDVIALGKVFDQAPSVQANYLSGTDINQLAIVRGTIDHTGAEPSFGKSDAGTSYMIQWTDGTAINSILLEEYGNVAPALDVDVATGRMTLAQPPATPEQPPAPTPVVSDFNGASFQFDPLRSAIQFFSTPANVVAAEDGSAGFIDASGFNLLEYAGGVATPAWSGYTSGPSFGITGSGNLPGKLVFGEKLEVGVYRVQWEDDTIATSTGSLSPDGVFFSGGHVAGQIFQQGFALDSIMTAFEGVNSDSSVSENIAYIGSQGSKIIHTGGGKDVVVSNGAQLLLQYDVIDNASQDLVLGFEHGRDTLEFSGDAAARVDRDGDFEITWAEADESGMPSLTDSTEAVSFMLGAGTRILTEQVNMPASDTFAALQSGLGNQQLPDSLLILAHTNEANGSILMHFTDANNSGALDADELSVIAVFGASMPEQDDISIVGVPGGIGTEF